VLRATAVHLNHVDGFVVSYTMSKPGAPGTDLQPIDPDGDTIIDAVKPTVDSVTVVPIPAIEGGVTVTVEFNEGPMDNSVNPTVTVEGLSSSYTVDKDSYIGNIWTGAFTLLDEGDATHAHISVSDGQDLAGNVMLAELEAYEFQVDTKEPTVTTLTVSPTLLSDSEVGLAFAVTVDYSEAMKGVAPTITFDPTVTSTLNFASGIWIDADTYEATYDVADAGVTFDDVKVIVEDAEDLAGNVQVAYTKSAAFDIDTENPTVSIEVSDVLISDADVPGPFKVKATFSEAMDTTFTPTVSFDQNVDSTLKSAIGAWIGNTVYEVTYTTDDAGVEMTDVDVRVGGAKDLADNLQALDPTTKLDAFSIDTLEPAAPTYLSAPAYINIANQLDYPVSGTAEAGTTVTVQVGAATNTGPADPTNGAFTINVNALGQPEGPTSVSACATDAAGNTGPSTTITVTKDTVKPTCSATADPALAKAGPVTVTVEFSEDMDTTASPTVEVTELKSSYTVPETFYAGDTWEGTFNLGDDDEEEIAHISVIGGKDLAGNGMDDAPTAGTFDVDTREPEVFIDLPEYINLANEKKVPVTITSDEDGDYSYDVGGVTGGDIIYAVTPVSFDLDLSGLPDGHVTAYASVEDLAGNVGEAWDSALKDTIPPDPSFYYFHLSKDVDKIGIANIGDTLRVDCTLVCPDIASFTVDLQAYGGSTATVLMPIAPPIWFIEFVIVDSEDGIDVAAGDPASAVTVTATDFAGNTATATSYPLGLPVDSRAPEPPTGLTATAIAGGKIRLDWTASVAPDLAFYNIYRDIIPDPTTLVATGVTGTTWTELDPLAETVYYYRMKSVDDAKNIGDYSNEDSSTADSTPPAAPDADKLVVTENPPGTTDTIKGLPGAVESNAEVTVYSDSGLSVILGTAMATGDGSFPAIDIGDNLNAKVWVTATDAAGNEGQSTMKTNDIEAPEITSISWSINGMPEVTLAGTGDEITITLLGEERCIATFDIVDTKTT